MKLYTLPELRLVGRPDMQTALDAVFGPQMLQRVHGASLRGAGVFDPRGRRTFTFSVRVDNVPSPIRRFFCGSELNVTSRQALDTRDDAMWTITSRIKLHFVGAEFFKLRPSFCLRRGEDGAVTLSARVRHDAVLPPPLNGIAEGFMALNTQRELQHFAACLREGGVIEASPELTTSTA